MSSKSLHVLFDDDDNLLDAVKEVVKNKIYINEVYTPFPVHGLDKAMKLKPQIYPSQHLCMVVLVLLLLF